MSVSVTMGVMKPLLGKLATLAGDEYSKLKGVKKQASFLEKELSAMSAALEKMELMDELDPVAKDWRDHVREMSYDMENCIDDFIRQFGGGHTKAGFIKKTARRLKTLRERHQIANRMEELKVLALEANERRIRYKIDECNYGLNFVVNDPRVSAIWVEAAGLVGTDGPREEVANLLMDTENELKVVSMVGFGGLGKTALAQQVYDEIGGKFNCKAFVPISQRPNMTGLLSCLEFKLGMSSWDQEIQNTIDAVKTYLTDKRYLIVLDDLWDQSAWNIVSRAFPENCNGSRVLVTTRVEDVALVVCRNRPECIYRMEPLNNKDSKKLFFGRVYGSEEDCPSRFEEVSIEILKKCGGLPLAIITVASILASRPERLRDEWESIKDSLSAQFAIYPTLEGMKSILNLSYMHLPLYLRACFLYLGMYPEDWEIESNDLVQQWIGEGFVSNLHGQDLEVVAKKYFNELISRNMIQPVRTENGEVLSFRVHDLMVDLILSKCAEDNFISMAYNQEGMAALHRPEYKVRRLSLKSSDCCSTPLQTIPTSLSQVRSFALFGESTCPYPLSEFKYLRVLVFEVPGFQKVLIDLRGIDQLFQLRYLKAYAHSGMIRLRAEIGGVVHLETLEIHGWSSTPSDIVVLPRLSHLILPCNRGLARGIESIKSLRTLHCFRMERSLLQDIKGLGELTNLRELRLSSWEVERDVDALVSSIGKLWKLRNLSMDIKSPQHDDDQLFSLSNPPPLIEKLEVQRWTFKRVPKWICDLHYLHTLSLFVEHLSTEDAHVLGKLPGLVHLSLNVLRVPEDGAPAVVCTGLFPFLHHLRLRSDDDDSTACMEFEAGAMPKLLRLVLQVREKWGGVMPVGMEHLLALEQIHIDNMSSAHEDSDVESAFRNAAQVHPRRPSVAMC